MKKIDVLVIDDETVFCMILVKRLEALGYSAFSVTSAKDALEFLNEVQPGMIITDLMMPEMDGIELCRILRKKRSLNNTFILMLSARSDKEARDDSTMSTHWELG